MFNVDGDSGGRGDSTYWSFETQSRENSTLWSIEAESRENLSQIIMLLYIRSTKVHSVKWSIGHTQ